MAAAAASASMACAHGVQCRLMRSLAPASGLGRPIRPRGWDPRHIFGQPSGRRCAYPTRWAGSGLKT
eukprot:3883386-Alexandrium_andersonii.AAC.1